MIGWLKRVLFTARHNLYWFWQNIQLVPVMWRFSALKPPHITFFGGGRLSPSDRYVHDAQRLARMCVEHGMTIITGGGRGIMEAAAQGALDAGCVRTSNIGISLSGIDVGYKPHDHSVLVRVDNLVVRKWLMTHFSLACVVFPGGVGTQNEFAELLTLFDLGLLERIPVVLYGREYWHPLVEWIVKDGIARGFVGSEITHMFVQADSVEEAFGCLQGFCSVSAHDVR